MKELVAIFEGAGCAKTRTYIQSGNILFEAPPEVAAQLPALITERIQVQYGIQVPVLLRSSEELAGIILKNPFPETTAKQLFVMFLAAVPAKSQLHKLDPKRSPPDQFVFSGREFYLLLPNGAGKTRLTNAYFDAKLGTTSTSRNWQTVKKLLALMDESDSSNGR